MTDDSHFRQFLAAAREQPEPCRVLFVFVAAELSEDATPAQRERFLAGKGGVLAPVMCVDKAPGDLSSFAQLAEESRHAGCSWSMVFAAGLAGSKGRPPEPAQVDEALQIMVQAIRDGGFSQFAAYDGEGAPVLFE